MMSRAWVTNRRPLVRRLTSAYPVPSTLNEGRRTTNQTCECAAAIRASRSP